MCQQTKSSRGQFPSFSAHGVQMPFLSRLHSYQGIRIVHSSSKLSNLAFVCKSTKQITPLLVP